MDDCVFVYSMGRSGGSSLCNAIELLVNFDEHYFEPLESYFFDEDFQEDYKVLLDDFFGQKRILFKHNLENLFYLDDEVFFEIEKTLFEKFERVLVNSRSNWLKHAVSEVISAKTDNWQDQHSLSDFNKSFEMSVESLENIIEKRKSEWKSRLQFIKSNEDINEIFINYENFYNQISLQSRVEHLIDILNNFYGFTVSTNQIFMVYNVLSEESKINDKNSYKMVSNIDEINRVLGRKYGFLF